MAVSATARAPRPADRILGAPSSDRRRWLTLACVALAQLMVALDATIVSIALPSAQATLRFSDAERQWVITAYTLAFGGLLLLGGRLADVLGRKAVLLVGLAGFALASGASGAATSLGMLVGARALQGAAGALLTPTALSVLAVTFTDPRERAQAFGVYGAIAAGGAAVGLVLGGFLAQYLTWRWCLFVNVPIALVAAMGAWAVLGSQRPAAASAARWHLDPLGLVLGGGGLTALTYGVGQAAGSGWGARAAEIPLLAGVAALALFAVHELRTEAPLLPPRIVLDRGRGGASLSALLAVAGMFGAFLFLTYELQVGLRFPPLQAGLAFLPMSAATVAGSNGVATRLLPRVSPRGLMVPGFLVAAAGMGILSQIQVGDGYLARVLPAEILLGLGIACVMTPAASEATSGVDPREAGVAAAALNTAQQAGASLGTATMNTVAASATAAFLASSPSAAQAAGLVHGYAAAASWGALILVVGAGVAWLSGDGARGRMGRAAGIGTEENG